MNKNGEITEKDNAYPPWHLGEVLFFYFVISLIVFIVANNLTISIARGWLGISDIAETLADPYDPKSQIYYNILNMIVAVIMTVLLYRQVCIKYGMPFRKGFRINWPSDFKNIYFIPIIGVILFGVFILRDFRPEDMTRVPIYAMTSTLPSFLLFVAGAILIAPIYEELFFRGYLYPAIEQAWNPLVATIVVSLFFTWVHVGQLWGDWVGILIIFCFSLIVTVIRAIYGSTLLCMIAHLLYNVSLVAISIIAHIAQH